MEEQVLESLPDDHIPQTAEEAEQLIGQWESPQTPEAVPQGQNTQTQPVADGITPKLEKYLLKRHGKEIELELTPEKRLALLQQGYDYSENMRSVREQREHIERMAKDLAPLKQAQERLKQYEEIEKYQKQDPAWWEHVVQSYQQRQAEQGRTQAPPELVQKVEELSNFVQSQKEKAELETQAKEDGELDKIISDYRTAHPDFDWNGVDDKGMDLERRIIEHAISMGITKASGFKAAADSYLLDKHLEKAKLGAKENLGKTIQKQAKLGLGPVTTKRTLQPNGVKNVSAKSYEDIYAEVVDQYNLGN